MSIFNKRTFPIYNNDNNDKQFQIKYIDISPLIRYNDPNSPLNKFKEQLKKEEEIPIINELKNIKINSKNEKKINTFNQNIY